MVDKYGELSLVTISRLTTNACIHSFDGNMLSKLSGNCVHLPFVESKEISTDEIQQLGADLSTMMRTNRVRLTKGATGHYYISYFDEQTARNRQEPFRTIKLPKQQ